jgi:transposase-like protein
MKTFNSILAFQKEFDTHEKCVKHLELSRWNGTPCCPFCASIGVHRFPNGKTFKCRDCRKKFSVTVGTIYENTKIPLTKWYLAQYILCVHSKGISSLQLAGWLDVTQKTAWFLNHRIREMLTAKKPELLNGIVEVDETYVGGKEANKHQHKKSKQRGYDKKTMVIGAVQRGGTVRVKVMPQTNTEQIEKFIGETIQPKSNMVTDEHAAYNRVHLNYEHDRINHGNKEYVRGNVHTNTIEGYWSLLKRQIVGIHHSVSPQHLQRYCNESAYRYNSKDLTQDERFAETLANCEGRLKYRWLINKPLHETK